jgi:hypothetical protein
MRQILSFWRTNFTEKYENARKWEKSCQYYNFSFIVGFKKDGI